MGNRIELSEKQIEFINNATHRFNGKIGATQCGKTYLDTNYLIPARILERRGKQGLCFIVGVSKSTIERNVLEPMRQRWGDGLIGGINSQNVVRLFGEKVYCLGGEKVSQVSKLRGAQAKYIYIDELVDIHEEVFAIARTRLSLPYSVCDFTGNPKYPSHYVKRFIDDQEVDVWAQSWTLYDNPFLDPGTVKAMEAENKGVFRERYILGRWARAEGVIYKDFADNTQAYYYTSLPPLQIVTIGVDYGASRSKTTFRACGISGGFGALYVLEERDLKGVHTSEQMESEFAAFYGKIADKYCKCQYAFCDYGALGQVLTAGIYAKAKRERLPVQVADCEKLTILDRIGLVLRLMAQGRFFINPQCKKTIQAFCDAVWDEQREDVRLDDGSTDIDSLDAVEYGVSSFYNNFIRRG